jgi:hypothetical protein
MCRRSRILAVVLFVWAPTAGVALAIDCYTEIAPVYSNTDVRSLIHVHTPADVERVRRELTAYIWKAPALPSDLPEVQKAVRKPFLGWGGARTIARADQLTVSIDGFVSRMYLLFPARTNGSHSLMIYHHGHSPFLAQERGRETVRFFLERGYLVLIAFPPLFGPNTGPIPDRSKTPAPRLSEYHDLMFKLETPTLSPIKYFLEPVVRAVNYAQQVLHLQSVYMIGISGGGWTTTLVAALDPRIRFSFPVAGSLPFYLRRRDRPCPSRIKGDREQYHPPLYAIADYLDLYVLGAYGRGRGQLQVLNQYDPCCFSGVGFRTYEDIVKDVVDKLGEGRYDVFLDSSHKSHLISRHALVDGVLPFLAQGRPEGGSAPAERHVDGAAEGSTPTRPGDRSATTPSSVDGTL